MGDSSFFSFAIPAFPAVRIPSVFAVQGVAVPAVAVPAIPIPAIFVFLCFFGSDTSGLCGSDSSSFSEYSRFQRF